MLNLIQSAIHSAIQKSKRIYSPFRADILAYRVYDSKFNFILEDVLPYETEELEYHYELVNGVVMLNDVTELNDL